MYMRYTQGQNEEFNTYYPEVCMCVCTKPVLTKQARPQLSASVDLREVLVRHNG